MNDLRIAIMGAEGRMGQQLVRAVAASEGCVVAGATERPGSVAVGKDIGVLAGLGPMGVNVSDNAEAVIAASDAILDFTAPAATLKFADMAARGGIVHVIGTTGFSQDDEAKIRAAAERARIIKAGNMSLGVNLLTAVTRRVSAALDMDFDIEIVEMHHRHKVDAPSGTALMLAHAAADGRGVSLEDTAVRVRDGHTGPRAKGAIGMQSLRGGSVVGDHTVILAGEGERIELTHRAEDRSIFARGAVKAALWGRDKAPGLYSMIDVLGL
ncbi:4-hydroxy-tetrahydrodipicolinate reductase [Filomicrobium sp.]|uniref:4-hydroxy-tetrahydrodipicolinate reductase n=1 Tax=Filomicrobium sp. TaxID=2024831 RepID=UPI002582DF7F|nr:4-hydroxy-tetrahydrodipicolinate reductase [Filomicrobium sp.]MCV0370629.1 4-hydroxy-tetrahydrodipicolinate reductase [Filomicrobium sp.]